MPTGSHSIQEDGENGSLQSEPKMVAKKTLTLEDLMAEMKESLADSNEKQI